MRTVFVFLFMILATACGQKGDLYLPQPAPDLSSEEDADENDLSETDSPDEKNSPEY